MKSQNSFLMKCKKYLNRNSAIPYGPKSEAESFELRMRRAEFAAKLIAEYRELQVNSYYGGEQRMNEIRSWLELLI